MSTKREDGRAFSPIVKTDCKFFGELPYTCVDVRFGDEAEIRSLIESLQGLLAFPSEGYDHVHVQDAKLGDPTASVVEAEITFWHPSVERNDIASSCVADAAKSIRDATKKRLT